MKTIACTTLSACLAVTVSASADTIAIGSLNSESTENLGSFTGSIAYEHVGLNQGSLIVSLTNTTLAGNGGFLTGFVFNINSADAAASATLTSASFASFLNTAAEAASPFGSYDAGAALGADWSGGGSPNAGIPIGQTGVFNFSVTASDAATLTAMSFVTGPNEFDFVVRFRGMNGAGSDKVPAQVVPGAAGLALMGLAGASSRRRR